MKIIYLLILCVLTFSCAKTTLKPYSGHAIKKIEIDGILNNSSAEISGLDWYGGYLIIMPENPESFSNNNWFRLSKDDLWNYINGTSREALKPDTIKIAGTFNKIIEGAEGFEALTFSDDTVFATIEAEVNPEMKCWLVKGTINKRATHIMFDTTTIAEIPLQVNIDNFTIESILIYNEEIICIFEANGKNINSNTFAYRFDKKLKYIGTIPFPEIEYRVTDASRIKNSTFWIMNIFYPGESSKLKVADETFIPKTTPNEDQHIERLIRLQIKNDKIEIADSHPLMIEVIPDDVRNWEGLALLDDAGFLIINDEFPRSTGTILAFIPFKDQ